MERNGHTGHTGYAQHLMIWLALLLLTGITVTAASLQLGQWSILAAIVIACIKGSLVLYFFMHLRREPALFKVALSVAVLTLACIMVLSFADYSFR